MKRTPTFDQLAPFLFVAIWSTGWIVPRYSSPDVGPLLFLAIRFALAGLVMAGLATLAKAPWPTGRNAGRALFSGIGLHAVYLGGVWWAIAHGAPSTLSALLATVQPILTALIAPRLLGEPLTARKGAGVALGFAGLVVTLSPQLVGAGGLSAPALPLAVNLIGMLGITAAAIYQKKHFLHGDLRSIAALQYAAACAVMTPAALLLETPRFALTGAVIGAMAWSVIALSVGAILLLLLLIRHGEASRAAQLIYLVPPTSALQAAALFGERLSVAQIVGFAVTVAGVALARSG